jgi:hypothetical protein
VSAGIGVFEVGLALRGTQELGLTPYQIALMFTECSLIMFMMQAVVFRLDPSTHALAHRSGLFVLVGLVPRAVASDFG